MNISNKSDAHVQRIFYPPCLRPRLIRFGLDFYRASFKFRQAKEEIMIMMIGSFIGCSAESRLPVTNTGPERRDPANDRLKNGRALIDTGLGPAIIYSSLIV